MAAGERVAEDRGWLDLARDWTSGLELPQLLGDADSPSPLASTQGPAVALVLVAQAYVAWVLSGVGMFARAGLSWAGYGAILAQQLVALGLELGVDESRRGTAIRTLLDESSAQLRELGELSVQEARALQRNLLALAEQLRDLDDETLDDPPRYGKVKR
jgi:hypothetical protein